MTSTKTLIRIQSLPHLEDVSHYEIINISMTSEDRQRVHRRITASDGQSFALELPTGTVLPVGQTIHISKDTRYKITAADEDVLTIKPQSLDEAAFAGHLIGNLHRDIDIVKSEILALWTAPLEHKLKKANLTFVRESRPFKGRPAGEHSH